MLSTTYFSNIGVFEPPFMYDDFKYFRVKITPLPDVLSAITREQLNGDFTVTLTYKSDGENADKLVLGNMLVLDARPWESREAMRIYSVVKRLKGSTIEVKAEHAFNEIRSHITDNLATDNQLPASYAGAWILGNLDPPLDKLSGGIGLRYRFSSDVETMGRLNTFGVNGMDAFAGTEGSFLDTYGGEFYRHNELLRHSTRIGSDTDYVIQYGTNLSDINMTITSDNVVRGVAPYWRLKDPNDPLGVKEIAQFAWGFGDGGTGVSDTAHFTALNPYGTAKNNPLAKIIAIDFTGKEDWANITDASTKRTKLINYGRDYIKTHQSTISTPAVNIKIDFIDLADKKGYEEYKSLATLQLGDTITLKYPLMKLDVPIRIISYEYNVLTHKMEKMELGQPTKKYLDKVSEHMMQLSTATKQNLK